MSLCVFSWMWEEGGGMGEVGEGALLVYLLNLIWSAGGIFPVMLMHIYVNVQI